jgi:hypothetical protein
LECGRSSRGNAGENDENGGEKEDAPVDGDVAEAGRAGRYRRFEQREADGREEESERAAERCHQDAFGDELADDAMARRSHGGANSDFFFANGCARQCEIGDVGAGDQQDERNRDDKDQQAFANVADHAGLEGDRREIRVPGFWHWPRKHRGDLRLDEPDFGVGLLQRGAGTKTRNGGHEIAAPIGVRVARIDVKRSPDFGL